MKKTFSINVPNKKPARQVDSIKHEIKKYISRERRKQLPENVDFWDFKCRIGISAESSEDIHLSELNSSIDALVASGKEEFYLQILAKAGRRNSKKN